MRLRDLILFTLIVLGGSIALYWGSANISGASIIWIGTDTYTVSGNEALTINLLLSFSSSSPLNFTIAEQPELYVVLDGGNLSVVPAPGSSGSIPLTITANDGASTITKSITVVVNGAGTKAPASFAPASAPSFSPSDITACGTIIASDTLTNNISSSDTCITIGADDVTLDCAGYTITYANGSQGDGILVEGFTNVVIKNCIIIDANYTDSFGVGINFTSTSNSRVFNNTIFTNGSDENYGIRVQTDSSYNEFENNTIFTDGSDFGNIGISLTIGTSFNNVTNNTIVTNGTTGNDGISIEDSENNTLSNNSIRASGTGSSNSGLDLAGAINNTIENNLIIVNGTASNTGLRLSGGSSENQIRNNSALVMGTSSNLGIFMLSSSSFNIVERNALFAQGSASSVGVGISTVANNNTIINNDITANGTGPSNRGVIVLGTTNNTFYYNRISTNGSGGDHGMVLAGVGVIADTNNITTLGGTDSYGMAIISSFTNVTNTLFNDTIAWINITTATSTNFTNTTFATPNGSVRIIPTVVVSGPHNITRTELNILFNSTFVNSTDLDFFNTTGEITLIGLSFVDPSPVVDLEDDGTFALCTDCIEESFAGGVFVFSVTHFTNYSGAESCPLYVNDTSTLSGNLSCPWTAVIINASNINFTCANLSTITFDTDGTGNDSGINLTGVQNVAIANCIIIDGNSSGDHGDGVFLADANLSTILNNSIWTNGTFRNIGIHLNYTSYNNTLINNTIYTTGTDIENHGIFIHDESNFNQAYNNTINTNGTSGNAGFAVEMAHNNTIANNSANTQGASLNTGITVLTNAVNNTVANNTFNTNGTSLNIGIRLLTNASNTLVINNSVSTHGTSLNNFGIWVLGTSSHNNISQNIVMTNGTTGGFGIVLNTAAFNNTFTNNAIFTSGSGGNNGGIFVNGGTNNTFSFNRISTNGTTNNYGIRMQSAVSENNTFNTNNITTMGTTSYGIYIINVNFTNFTNTILNNTVEWMNATVNTLTNITNTTFANDNGSIRLIPTIQINGSQNIIQDNLNITFNNTMLNTTNLSFLNVSSQITLLGLPFTSPIPLVEVDEDGIFQACYTTCTPVSYSAGTFVYDITHFTNHSAAENTTSIVITSGDFTANITPAQSAICTFQTDNLSAASGCFVVVSSAFNGTALSILNNGTAAFGLNITPDVCPFEGACVQQVKANGTAGLPSNASCNPALNFITVTAGVPINIHKNVPAGEQVFVSINYTFAINSTVPGFKLVAYNFTTVSDSPYFDPAC